MASSNRLLIAIGGLSGTGKSTLAHALAPPLDAAVFRSDTERKAYFGVSETTRLGPEAYAQDVTAGVYERLRTGAAATLRNGRSVIVDAVFLRDGERAMIEAVAVSSGAAFVGLWLDADLGTRRSRVATRTNDASDATEEVVDLQSTRDPGDLTWHRIPAGGGADQTLEATLRLLSTLGETARPGV